MRLPQPARSARSHFRSGVTFAKKKRGAQTPGNNRKSVMADQPDTQGTHEDAGGATPRAVLQTPESVNQLRREFGYPPVKP